MELELELSNVSLIKLSELCGLQYCKVLYCKIGILIDYTLVNNTTAPSNCPVYDSKSNKSQQNNTLSVIWNVPPHLIMSKSLIIYTKLSQERIHIVDKLMYFMWLTYEFSDKQNTFDR